MTETRKITTMSANTTSFYLLRQVTCSISEIDTAPKHPLLSEIIIVLSISVPSLTVTNIF